LNGISDIVALPLLKESQQIGDCFADCPLNVHDRKDGKSFIKLDFGKKSDLIYTII
jgi:hypothetical protein